MFSLLASSDSRVHEVLGHLLSLSSVKVEYYESILERVPHDSVKMKTLVGKRIYDKFVLETNLLLLITTYICIN